MVRRMFSFSSVGLREKIGVSLRWFPCGPAACLCNVTNPRFSGADRRMSAGHCCAAFTHRGAAAGFCLPYKGILKGGGAKSHSHTLAEIGHAWDQCRFDQVRLRQLEAMLYDLDVNQMCEVEVPCKIFGDIHGQLRDLLLLLPPQAAIKDWVQLWDILRRTMIGRWHSASCQNLLQHI